MVLLLVEQNHEQPRCPFVYTKGRVTFDFTLLCFFYTAYLSFCPHTSDSVCFYVSECVSPRQIPVGLLYLAHKVAVEYNAVQKCPFKNRIPKK